MIVPGWKVAPRHRALSRLFLSFVLVIPAFGTAAARADEGYFASASRSYSTGQQVTDQAYRPTGQAAADFDGDGDLDVAFAHQGNWINPHASLLFNNGDGSYGTPVFFPTSGETYDVAAADLDGDGDPDLAFAQTDGVLGASVLVFLNLGGGTFGAERRVATGTAPTGIVAFDADRDGDLDLATANNRWGEQDVSVLYNEGLAVFLRRSDFTVGEKRAYRLAAGDLNGDGFPDLAVTLSDGLPAFVLLLNDGAGGYGAPQTYTTGYEYVHSAGVALADMDRDGDRDVLYGLEKGGNSVDTAIGLYRNRGNGTLDPPLAIVTGNSFGNVNDFAVGDVTGDGWPDVLGVGISSQYGFTLVASDGAGGFLRGVPVRAGESARAVSLGDVDGDGDLDALVAAYGSNKLTVHRNQGGAFPFPVTYSGFGSVTTLEAGDVDRDGDQDLVAVDRAVTILKNGGAGTFTVQGFDPQVGEQQELDLADVTGDGRLDLLLLDGHTSPPYDFHVLPGRIDGSFGPRTDVSLPSCGTGGFEPVDLDGDRDLDVVVTEYLGCIGEDSNQRLYVLKNRGAGTFDPPILVIDFSVTKPEDVVAGDFDGDGRQDVVTDHPDTIAFWRGLGDGTFAPPVESRLGEWGPKHLVAADFNADGNLDVATANFGDNLRGENISVLLGRGDGTFAARVYYGLFSLDGGSVKGLAVLDADGDGDGDLAAGAYAADDLALFLNHGDGTFEAERRYGVAGEVLDVAAADFDGDGVSDLAATLSVGPPIGSRVTVVQGRRPGGPLAALRAVSLEPAAVPSGGTSAGTVYLTSPAPAGGAEVLLASSDPEVATVPATATVAEGATFANFTVQARTVAVTKTAQIRATLGAVTRSATLTVEGPATQALSSLTLNPTELTGTQPCTATVTLDAPASAGGAAVALTSSDTAAATVPATVTVPAGATSLSFPVTTHAVTATRVVTLTGSYGGQSRSATLTVHAPTLWTLTVTPANVTGGCARATGKTTLTGKAPAGGLVVTLRTTNPAATLPASVTFPAGSSSASFTITTATVAAKQYGDVTASHGQTTIVKPLTVAPVALKTLTLTPNPVVGPGAVAGRVTLTCAAPAGGVAVTLTSSNTAVARPAVAGLTIPAGATFADFTVTTADVAAISYANIKAVGGGVSKTLKLTVNP